MDVRAENRGRPHQKVRFPAAPVVGRNFLTPGHSGVRVRNVRRKSGPKSLCLCCFFFPEFCRKPPFARKLGTEDEIFAIAFAFASEFLRSASFVAFCFGFGCQDSIATFPDVSEFAFAFAGVAATAVHSGFKV